MYAATYTYVKLFIALKWSWFIEVKEPLGKEPCLLQELCTYTVLKNLNLSVNAKD